MERNTKHAQRVEMVERHLKGESLAHIARDMGLNYYTIRTWWRAYRDAGWEGLVPKSPGPPKTGALSDFEPVVKYVALRLKRENPAWGLDVLRLHMKRRRSLTGKRIPRRTALYNYLKPFYPRFRPDYRGRTSQPSPPATDTQAVHQRWQMDFKGRESIAPEGQVAPWLVCDEFSSAPLAGIIYTKCTGEPKAGLSWRDLQANLGSVKI
jgi:putative transposase